MLKPDSPALVLAPMDGITDAPMRALQGASGAFTYAVSEFVRISNARLPKKVFRRDIPELNAGAKTHTGMPVQVQILGGDPDLMAQSALNAVAAGAQAIDINFGCPAPTVNRHDGGASLLRQPTRIREVVAAIREAVPTQIPVSAKLRLGWDCIDDAQRNAEMAAEGGANWLTIHARTRVQGYSPPVYWSAIGDIRKNLNIPVVANGDIWSLDDFRRCQDETGCRHFMIGRGALADPSLPYRIAKDLFITSQNAPETNWPALFKNLMRESQGYGSKPLMRFKQWLALASKFGGFPHFDQLKHAATVEEFFQNLESLTEQEIPLAS